MAPCLILYSRTRARHYTSQFFRIKDDTSTLTANLQVITDSRRLSNFIVAKVVQMQIFIGIIIICMALCFDAVFGNYQEKLLKKYPHFTNADIIFYTYSFGSVIIFTWLVGE